MKGRARMAWKLDIKMASICDISTRENWKCIEIQKYQYRDEYEHKLKLCEWLVSMLHSNRSNLKLVAFAWKICGFFLDCWGGGGGAFKTPQPPPPPPPKISEVSNICIGLRVTAAVQSSQVSQCSFHPTLSMSLLPQVQQTPAVRQQKASHNIPSVPKKWKQKTLQKKQGENGIYEKRRNILKFIIYFIN